jgi:hypothetical protein
MPNILLTNFCNRSCPYCFALAQVKVGTWRPHWEMSDNEFKTILSYLNPQRDVVSLLGGEPTLHSRFAEIVALSVSRRYRIKIFTNGTTEQLRQISGTLTARQLTIILNLNAPHTYPDNQWAQIQANCEYWGDRLRLSFNIFEPDFDWSYLKEAIVNWQIGPYVRIGITQPIRGMANQYLPEKDLPQTYSRLVDMAEDMAREGITLGLDCGFRACGFSETQLGTLIECGTQLLFDCKPVLDIGPDLMVWRCFPFATFEGVHLTDFSTMDQIASHFDALWQEGQHQGNTAECATCENHLVKTCKGGCLSRTINTLSEEAVHD